MFTIQNEKYHKQISSPFIKSIDSAVANRKSSVIGSYGTVLDNVFDALVPSAIAGRWMDVCPICAENTHICAFKYFFIVPRIWLRFMSCVL